MRSIQRLLLFGDSGIDKTMVVEKFLREHPNHFDQDAGVERIAVMSVQMPQLGSGMSFDAIIADYPTLTEADILACLGYAAVREQNSVRISLAA